MLDRAGDADRDVNLGRDDLAGLADLIVVRRIAGIHRRAARAAAGIQLVGQRIDQRLELLRRTNRAAARHDDLDRTSVEEGKSVCVRVDLVGRRFLKSKNSKTLNSK